jgi:hypothetical protein
VNAIGLFADNLRTGFLKQQGSPSQMTTYKRGTSAFGNFLHELLNIFRRVL